MDIANLNANFSYKYCDSGGIKDFKIIWKDLKNITPKFEKIFKKFEDLQELQNFKKFLREKTIDVVKNLNDINTIRW